VHPRHLLPFLLFLGACAPSVGPHQAATPAAPPPIIPAGVTEAQPAAPTTGEWLAAYDVARAYARVGDERAQPALDVALERGGDAARQRALRDPDFDGVRTGPWFRRLVGTP
jgi:hypothetical protein